jgi:hypothetical protein
MSTNGQKKIQKWSHNVTHEEGVGRPSTATTDDNVKRVRDVTPLDRQMTVYGVANRLQIVKNYFTSFKFLLK